MRAWSFAAAMALLVLLGLSISPAGAQALKEESGFLRVKIGGRESRLEVLIVKPDGAGGRLPLALITHGKSPSGLRMSDVKAATYGGVARDFARRGWLAAVVVRRGFGQSDGPFRGGGVSCASPNLAPRLADDAEEMEAALIALRQRPDVDPEQALAIGESAGGLAMMALARKRPPGLRGVINVAGGLMLDECAEKSRDALVAAVAGWRGTGYAPQLWIYAQNDELFPPATVDRMRSAALDGGGDIRFVELNDIKPPGHLIFIRGRMAWLPELDSSLRAWKLPTWPAELAGTEFARLGLSERAPAFERYFSMPGEKALAYSPSRKMFRYWFGAPTLEQARQNALQECGKAASDCRIAFDNNARANAE